MDVRGKIVMHTIAHSRCVHACVHDLGHRAVSDREQPRNGKSTGVYPTLTLVPKGSPSPLLCLNTDRVQYGTHGHAMRGQMLKKFYDGYDNYGSTVVAQSLDQKHFIHCRALSFPSLRVTRLSLSTVHSTERLPPDMVSFSMSLRSIMKRL